MSKLGFMILHYGAPYLGAAIESIYDQVDRIVILYTDRPSQGHITDIPCPDTEAELMKICNPFWDKITWVNSRWNNEWEHVGAIELFKEGYDWLVRLDSDEVFPAGMVDEMIRQADEKGPTINRFCFPFQHHWRSFGKVCRDGQMPVRLFRVSSNEGEIYLDSGNGKWVVNHMGYCTPTRYIEYKLAISAHHPEFRPEWLEERWKANAQADVHPVNLHGFWNPVDYDLASLPEPLKKHEHYGKDLIE